MWHARSLWEKGSFYKLQFYLLFLFLLYFLNYLMFFSVLIHSFPLYFIQWKSLPISQQFCLLSFCGMYAKVIAPKTVNMVANRTSSGFRAKYHNEVNDRWEMLIHCSHGFSLSANTVCITLCFALKEPQQLGFLFKVKVKTYEIWIYHCINSKAKKHVCPVVWVSWFSSAESLSQRFRLFFGFVISFLSFFPTVSNSQKFLVYYILVRYITLLFFWKMVIFHQRETCTPLIYHI